MKKTLTIIAICSAIIIYSCANSHIRKNIDTTAYVYVPKISINCNYVFKDSDKYLSKRNEAEIYAKFWTALENNLSNKNIRLFYDQDTIPNEIKEQVYIYEINYLELKEECKLHEVKSKTDSTKNIKEKCVSCNMLIHTSLIKDDFKDTYKSELHKSEADKEPPTKALKNTRTEEQISRQELEKSVYSIIAENIAKIEANNIYSSISNHIKPKNKRKEHKYYKAQK